MITHVRKTRLKRKLRSRTHMFGTATKPRVAVFRSNKHLFVQVIDDVKRMTFLGMSDRMVTNSNKLEQGKALGLQVAQKLKEKKIQQVIFDRSGYTYHGRIKAVAEGIREGGIIV